LSCRFAGHQKKVTMKKKIEHNRSAKTGHYVTEAFAKKHPATTVKETSKVPDSKKKP
jgi:hypothetical protein